MTCQMFHTESRMRENCTYGSMRGRTFPAGASRSTLHPLMPNRLYLTGFSYGGNGAYALAQHFPNVFAAVIPGSKRVRDKRYNLRFGDGTVTGIVRSPVPGEFVYGGCRVPLAVGETVLPGRRNED